jgi:hypothetical protein
MSTEQKPRSTARPPLPDGRPETWVYLADCPMPEDGKRDLEAELKEHRFRGQALVYLEENLKMTYLFGGLRVATKRTARGLTVINAEDRASMRLYPWLLALPLEESNPILIHYVEDPYVERETWI